MNAEWVYDRQPDKPGRYFCIVRFPTMCSYKTESVRDWDGGWKEMAPSEVIEKWLLLSE